MRILIDNGHGINTPGKRSPDSRLRNTACPAVLTENLFQDNERDVDYLLSAQGRKAIADLHVDGIIKYLLQL